MTLSQIYKLMGCKRDIRYVRSKFSKLFHGGINWSENKQYKVEPVFEEGEDFKTVRSRIYFTERGIIKAVQFFANWDNLSLEEHAEKQSIILKQFRKNNGCRRKNNCS